MWNGKEWNSGEVHTMDKINLMTTCHMTESSRLVQKKSLPSQDLSVKLLVHFVCWWMYKFFPPTCWPLKHSQQEASWSMIQVSWLVADEAGKQTNTSNKHLLYTIILTISASLTHYPWSIMIAYLDDRQCSTFILSVLRVLLVGISNTRNDSIPTDQHNTELTFHCRY